MSVRRQRVVGLSLAAAIVGAWVMLHLWGVFVHRWAAVDWVRTPALILIQSWLGAGMFIVAHDAIHGSLAPGLPKTNAAVGQVCVGLYAGFRFRKLAAAHQLHHAAPGTDRDPDFHPGRPRAYVAWLYRFFRQHFGLTEFAIVTVVLVIYLSLGAKPSNLVAFWAAPAMLSALQLFTFGTWLPHRHEAREFADEHRARSLDYPWLLSLLTCFHFGRHHEHHLQPAVPWWRLPQVKI